MLRGSLVLLLAVGAAADPAPDRRRARGTGAVATWILHFDPRVAEDAAPAYRDLLRQIDPDARVVVAVRGPAEEERFLDLVPADARVAVLRTGRPLSLWARDRYVSFRRDGHAVLLVPDPLLAQENRAGDFAVAGNLAGAKAWTEPGLSLEGGNVLVADDHVFVGANALADNAAWCGGHADEFRRRLGRVFGRRVVLVGDPRRLPHAHLDMYVAVAGRGRVLVADARGAPAQAEWIPVYDRIASALRGRGFNVFRIPVVHTGPGRLLTWTNAVTERIGDREVVYLPRYGRAAPDRRARTVWRRLGFEVRPIDVSRIIRHGGAVRCFTNTVR